MGLTESEPPTKEHTWADLRPPAHIVDVELGPPHEVWSVYDSDACI